MNLKQISAKLVSAEQQYSVQLWQVLPENLILLTRCIILCYKFPLANTLSCISVRDSDHLLHTRRHHDRV